jgi:hypothetical protein
MAIVDLIKYVSHRQYCLKMSTKRKRNTDKSDQNPGKAEAGTDTESNTESTQPESRRKTARVSNVDRYNKRPVKKQTHREKPPDNPEPLKLLLDTLYNIVEEQRDLHEWMDEERARIQEYDEAAPESGNRGITLHGQRRAACKALKKLRDDMDTSRLKYDIEKAKLAALCDHSWVEIRGYTTVTRVCTKCAINPDS